MTPAALIDAYLSDAWNAKATPSGADIVRTLEEAGFVVGRRKPTSEQPPRRPGRA